jgi:hypothetical protein
MLAAAVLADTHASPASPASETRLVEVRAANQALLYLARRRVDVLFAMFRDGNFYEPRTTTAVT